MRRIKYLHLILFALVNFISFSQKTGLDTLFLRLRKDLEELKDDNVYNKIESFDAEALNFDRYQGSPCFDKIGFNPTWDMNWLEQQYSECENEYYTKKTLNIIYVVLFISILIIIVIFSIPKEKRKALIKNLPKP